jgi:hypothetical protein
VFTINFIFWVDRSIGIGVIVSNDFSSNGSDVITRPSSWTINTDEWLFTISHTIIWTVSSSPFIFTFDNTVVEFTFVNNTISVNITIFNEDF